MQLGFFRAGGAHAQNDLFGTSGEVQLAGGFLGHFSQRQDQAYIPRLLADGGGGSPPLTDLEEDLSSCLNLVNMHDDVGVDVGASAVVLLL